jgi:threonylcarbamoyladenosine tRNA methylthiotransferase CDKAL1
MEDSRYKRKTCPISSSETFPSSNFANVVPLAHCSGVTQIDRVVEVVEETLKGNTVQLLKKKELPPLDLPKVRRNR